MSRIDEYWRNSARSIPRDTAFGHLFYGDQSELGKYLQALKPHVGSGAYFSQFFKTVPQLPSTPETGCSFVLQPPLHNLPIEVQWRLVGLWAAATGCERWLSNRVPIDDYLACAVDAFDLAWSTPPHSRPDFRLDAASSFQKELDSDSIERLLKPLRDRANCRGYWIVRDLLYGFNLPANQGDQSTEKSNVQSASTPVVLRDSNVTGVHGAVLWLTVELERGNCPIFAPDPLPLGLTEIHFKSDSFLHSMDKAWRLSGVGARGFRGRWRLQHDCPLEDVEARSKKWNGNTARFFPSISGPSAEVAALVAILAARGMVEYDNGSLFLENRGSSSSPDYASMKLIPQVVVSATLDDANFHGSLIDLSLGPVDSIDAKLAGADNYRLDDNSNTKPLIDTLLVASSAAEDVENPDTKTRKEETQAYEGQAKSAGFNKVRVVPLKTVGDVLDHMLQVNRWLHEWHRRTEALWLFGGRMGDQFYSGWDYLRNEQGNLVDETGQEIREEKIQLHTGSIEHMESVSSQFFRSNGESRE